MTCLLSKHQQGVETMKPNHPSQIKPTGLKTPTEGQEKKN